MFKTYYHLTKPGIIYGNAINTAAGFFLASQGAYDFKLLLFVLIGFSLVIASACVFNNILDTELDAKMERTKNRAMVTGAIPKSRAAIFGIILFLLGAITLHHHTNNLALFAGLAGFFVYLILYTYGKRYTTWGTEIGSLAGATPPLGGYLIVKNELDTGAIILFLIYVFWQMPHFYAIAIYRLNEYKQAGIPVLPAIKGIVRTKINTLIYILAFIVALSSLYFYRYTGLVYFTVMGLLGLAWLAMSIKGFKTADDNLWAKKMFRFSLIIVLAFCVIIPIDTLIR